MAAAFNQTVIPLDIIELVMEELANDSDAPVTVALRASALTCRAFLFICRKYIFSSIRLDGEWPVDKFKRILERNPVIARYVKHLEYFNDFSGKRGSRILRQLRRVRQLTIGSINKGYFVDSRMDWSTLSSSFRHSLQYFIQCNDIVALSLINTSNLPMYILWSFPNLVDLKLTGVDIASEAWPTKSKGPERPPSLSSLQVRGCSLKAMQLILDAGNGGYSPAFDVSELQDLYLDTEERRGRRSLDCINSLLRSSSRLRSLELTAYPGLNCLETLSNNLNEESLQTLKKITISPIIDEPAVDPYLHFTQVLERMAGKSWLEEITFNIHIDTGCRCTVEATTWAQLDVVLAGKGFPSLRRVLVQVTIAWYSPGYYQEFQRRLEALGDTTFLRLMENKQVDFEFVVKTEEVI